MPIYEYQCLECNKKVEAVQKFSDAPLTACLECGGELKKLISNTSFVLKGSGWYVTDYPSSDRKKAMESKKKDSKNKDSKSKSKGKKAEPASV